MNLRTFALIAFVLAVLAYFYLVFTLALAPARIIYGKTHGERPFAELLMQFLAHEVAVSACGGAVIAYSVVLFRRHRDWRPFAVLIMGVPLALAIYLLFGL